MALFRIQPSIENSVKAELRQTAKQELHLSANAHKPDPKWKTTIEAKIPQKVRTTLEAAFVKAFGLIFSHGGGIIDKTTDRESLMTDHKVRDYAVKLRQSRGELKKVRKAADRSDLLSGTLTTFEGIGLGALGIGLPDIVLFTGMLLRGTYECAANYGIDSETPSERYFILKLMEAALSKNEAYDTADAEVNALLSDNTQFLVTDDEMAEQTARTASAMALDMLTLKFIQGIPIAGIVGGVSNPVYYNKIMTYVKLKYYKRYLMGLAESD